MTNEEREKRERAFLEACGFDLSAGWWSEDVESYKEQEPELYKYYMQYYCV